MAFRNPSLLPLDDCLMLRSPPSPTSRAHRFIGACNGTGSPGCLRSKVKPPPSGNSRLDDVFARSNSDMGVTPLLEANLRHPEHSTTRLSWQKRMGNRDVFAMRNVSGRPTGVDGLVLVSHR